MTAGADKTAAPAGPAEEGGAGDAPPADAMPPDAMPPDAAPADGVRPDDAARDAPDAAASTVGGGAGQRIDKWLFNVRFFKTRSLAGKLAAAGKIRVDGRIVGKAHFTVRPGQVLTFVQGRHVRVVRVVALPERRGPAAEARACYEDLQPPTPDTALPRNDGPPGFRHAPAGAPAAREPGSGRPTKRDRRRLDRLRGT